MGARTDEIISYDDRHGIVRALREDNLAIARAFWLLGFAERHNMHRDHDWTDDDLREIWKVHKERFEWTTATDVQAALRVVQIKGTELFRNGL